jgi:hypothetical protein
MFDNTPNALESAHIQRDKTNSFYEQVNISGSDLVIYHDSSGSLTADRISVWATKYGIAVGGSLVSSSWASSSISSSYALTASFALNGGGTGGSSNSSSWASSSVQAYYATQSLYATQSITASYVSASNVNGTVSSASYANSASWAPQLTIPTSVASSSWASSSLSSSLAQTASVIYNPHAMLDMSGNLSVGSASFAIPGAGNIVFTPSVANAQIPRISGQTTTQLPMEILEMGNMRIVQPNANYDPKIQLMVNGILEEGLLEYDINDRTLLLISTNFGVGGATHLGLCAGAGDVSINTNQNWDGYGNVTAGTKLVVFKPSGRVGIGTTSPANPLDVVGNISCSVITASLFFGTASYVASASYYPSQVLQITVASASWVSSSAFITTAQTASYITSSNIFGKVSSSINSDTASYLKNSNITIDGNGTINTTANIETNGGEINTGGGSIGTDTGKFTVGNINTTALFSFDPNSGLFFTGGGNINTEEGNIDLGGGGITGSLSGTASWATNVSASGIIGVLTAAQAPSASIASIAATASCVHNTALDINSGGITANDDSWYINHSAAQLTSLTASNGVFLPGVSANGSTIYKASYDNGITIDSVVTAPSFIGNFTGSVKGTAATASYITASNIVGVLTAAQAPSASYSATASYITASGIVGVLTAVQAPSASYSSYAVSATSASWASSSISASYITASNIVGIVTSASIAATASYVSPSLLWTGSALLLSGSTGQTPLNIQSNVNNFSEIFVQNTNSGNTASTDIALENDLGTTSSYYVDVGINSSGYGAGFVGGANDGYLFLTSSLSASLYVGNINPSGSLSLFVGGYAKTGSSGLVINPNSITASFPITGSITNAVSASYASDALFGSALKQVHMVERFVNGTAGEFGGGLTIFAYPWVFSTYGTAGSKAANYESPPYFKSWQINTGATLSSSCAVNMTDGGNGGGAFQLASVPFSLLFSFQVVNNQSLSSSFALGITDNSLNRNPTYYSNMLSQGYAGLYAGNRYGFNTSSKFEFSIFANGVGGLRATSSINLNTGWHLLSIRRVGDIGYFSIDGEPEVSLTGANSVWLTGVTPEMIITTSGSWVSSIKTAYFEMLVPTTGSWY